MLKTNTPTDRNYKVLREAYQFFNRELFGDTLPDCLITLQRKANSHGYFAGARFGERAAEGDTLPVDEIALNPKTFASRSDAEILSTLVHEMVHLKQHHFGKPSKNHHNKEWAEMMDAVGLTPSNTGLPGGKRTGAKCSHYIVAGGRFDAAVTKLLATGFALPYLDIWEDVAAKAKAASKTKFTCPCCDANAWAKPDANLICGDCDGEKMEPAP